MARRIKLPSSDPGVVVELGSGEDVTEFRMVPVTMQVEEQLNDLERESREIEANPDSRPLDLCAAEVKQLDIILTPLNNDPKRPAKYSPSELLLGDDGDPHADPPREPRPGYVTGDVTRAQIRSTVERLIAAARPT